jgi:cell shape-determining protein MreC
MFRRYYDLIRHPTKSTIFVALMVVSLLVLWLPGDLLAPGRHMTELIAAPQWAANRAVQTVARPIQARYDQQVSGKKLQRLITERTLLENENVALRNRIASLEQTVREMTLLQEAGVAERGTLIPAPVVAADAASGRDTLLLGSGQVEGVRREDWVASRLLLRAGTSAGVQDDDAVIGRQSLLGWVEQAGPFTARVVLLSDAYAQRPLRVHIAHRTPSQEDPRTFQPRFVTRGDHVAEFILRGAGGGRMLIRDISHDFIEAGLVQENDLVLSDPRDPKLDQSLVVGEITKIRHNKDKPLLYDAFVRHRFDPKNLSQVLVVDRSRTASAD